MRRIHCSRSGRHPHGHGLARPRVTAALGIHGAVAAGPVVMAVADGIIAAGAMACAVVEAAAFLGSSQVVAQLVDAHGVVYGSSPDALYRSREVIRLFKGASSSQSSKKDSGLHALYSLPDMCLNQTCVSQLRMDVSLAGFRQGGWVAEDLLQL